MSSSLDLGDAGSRLRSLSVVSGTDRGLQSEVEDPDQY